MFEAPGVEPVFLQKNQAINESVTRPAIPFRQQRQKLIIMTHRMAFAGGRPATIPADAVGAAVSAGNDKVIVTIVLL
jgi:hypothetical protein